MIWTVVVPIWIVAAYLLISGVLAMLDARLDKPEGVRMGKFAMAELLVACLLVGLAFLIWRASL